MAGKNKCVWKMDRDSGIKMGYTITVQISDSNKRENALRFMQTHYSEWGKVSGNSKWQSHVRGPLHGPDLSYDRDITRIGFDYSCLCDPERHYMWCLIQWMALTFGDRYDFKEKELREYPYYVYDGDERMPVLVGDDWIIRPLSLKNYSKCESDGWCEWSFMHRPKAYKFSVIKNIIRSTWELHPKRQRQQIRMELSRLSKEWGILK